MKKLLLTILILILFLGVGAFYVHHQINAPFGTGGKVNFPPGTSVSQMGTKLAEAKLIRSPLAFKLFVRFKGWEQQLQAGEYEFLPLQTLPQVADKIRRGERILYRLIIPEGLNFDEISKRLVEAGLATPEQMNAAFRDPNYLHQLVKQLNQRLEDPIPFKPASLEGYLFPATYIYDSTTTLEQVLTQMTRSFAKQWDEKMLMRLRELGWSIEEATTLASLIEKETGQPGERPLIASVFYNRLAKGMLLQSDPTIIYGLKDFDGDIRNRDILNPHIYNTYVHPGLPPGPIASPGKASLMAALFPEESEYLFFVGKGDGSHYFSKDLQEHNQAVRRYQLK